MQELIYWQATEPLPEQEPFITIMAGVTFDKSYSMQRADSLEYVCAYIQSGQGTLVYEGHIYNLSRGDAFILHKHSVHTYYADTDDPFEFLWFNCTGRLIPLLLQAYQLDQQIIISKYNNEILFKEYHEICLTHSDPHTVYELCAWQFHRIVSSFADHIATRKQTESLPYQIKRYLDEHLNEPVSLKTLAQQIGRSPAYLNRCFKAAYKQTPYQYLLKEKLTAAETILTQTDMRICQVAALFGFNDEFHFSNTFYKHLGYRPNTIRSKKVAKA